MGSKSASFIQIYLIQTTSIAAATQSFLTKKVMFTKACYTIPHNTIAFRRAKVMFTNICYTIPHDKSHYSIAFRRAKARCQLLKKMFANRLKICLPKTVIAQSCCRSQYSSFPKPVSLSSITPIINNPFYFHLSIQLVQIQRHHKQISPVGALVGAHTENLSTHHHYKY